MPLLFSSHQLELVERLCDDLVILSDGAVVAAGPASSLRDRRDRPACGWSSPMAPTPASYASCAGSRCTDVDGDAALLELVSPGDGAQRGTAEAALLATLVVPRPGTRVRRVVRPLSEIFREVTR